MTGLLAVTDWYIFFIL